MRFASTLSFAAVVFAALAASAPRNPKFGSLDALKKRNNPKFDYPGSPDELEKRNNPKFDYPGSPDALE